MTSQAEFLTSYECIKSSFKNVMREVDSAVSHEENERSQEAIEAYERTIEFIEKIFLIPVGLPDNLKDVEPEWNDACVIIQKLKNTKSEITYRLKVLRTRNMPTDYNAVEASEEMTIKNEMSQAQNKSILLENTVTCYAINNDECDIPKTYKEIIKGLRDVIAEKDCDVKFDTIFQASAKLYKIEKNGSVTTVAGDSLITLVLCTVGGKWKYLNGLFFLQCSFPAKVLPASVSNNRQQLIWIYPLIPTVTACYRTEYGAFIFPDMESNESDAVFGIMISDDDASDSTTSDDEDQQLTDLQQFFLDLLEAVLAGEILQLTEQQRTKRPESDSSQQVSQNIVTVADFISRNLIRGAEKTGELMIKSTPYIMSKMQAAPADAPPVSTVVQTSVEVAKNVTSVAAGVTGWVAGKVGTASMALGRFLVPHIHTQGANLLEIGLGYNSEEANSKMEGAFTIAAGAVEGFSSVYNGLETSAKILGTSLSDNSVKIIEHKYGPSAANVAAGTFDTIGNAFNVSQNVNYITPKGIAKKMAKNTGKAVVIDYKRKMRAEESKYVPAGVLYPDLTALKEAHLKNN